MATTTVADMATAGLDKPFRFMDLPGELRNKVYTLLLCSFESAEAPTEELREEQIIKGRNAFKPVSPLEQNNPNILRTNSRIHREAYDIMVKTNRFIRVNCPGGLPFKKMIAYQDFPTIATGQHAAHFNEQLIDITVSCADPNLKALADRCPPESVVILGCQLRNFCHDFEMAKNTVPGLARSANIVISLAPILAHERPWYQDNLTDFFSDAIQEDLLAPLRAMRGIEMVKLQGPVAPEIAATLKAIMMSDRWEDPNSVIKIIRAEKDRGTQHYREGRFKEAYCTWADIMHEIERMHKSSCWAKLINIGGNAWIDQIAELKCSIALNTSLASIMFWGPDSRNISMPLVNRKAHRQIAEIGLDQSCRCAMPGHWKEGYTWTFPAVLRAKILYHRVVCIRTWGETSEVPTAMEFIRMALVLVPNDPVILKEREAIKRWASGA